MSTKKIVDFQFDSFNEFYLWNKVLINLNKKCFDFI